MLKQIFLAISFFCCLGINAQIQRTFFGMELGKASKQQVERKMKEKGYNLKIDDSDCIYSNNVVFGERTWDTVNFQFYDGKFYAISLLRKTKGVTGSDITQKVFDSISSILKEKYSDFIVVEEDHKISFNDETTHISLISGKDDDFGTKYVVLGYSDRKLMSERHKSAISEY